MDQAVTRTILWMSLTLLGLSPATFGQQILFESQLYQRRLEQERQTSPFILRGQDEPLGQAREDDAASGLGGLFSDPEVFAALTEPASATSADVLTAEVLKQSADSSLGGQIQKSAAAPSIGFQRRSPIAQSPYIRGYKAGQIYAQADGQHWLPVRMDLDSMISKLDPALIEDVILINGPYGLRYGPGFGYISVKTFDTPRYDCFTSHSRTGLSVHTNGGQLFGTETFSGGSQNYGFVVSYANRTAGDYRPGNNSAFRQIPSSYHVQNFLGQVGFDISENSKIEFRYNRLDQTDTEIAGQFWDIGFLETDAFDMTWTKTDDCNCNETRFEAWYNRTKFDGGLNPPLTTSKRTPYPVIDRVEAAIDRFFESIPTSPADITTRFTDNTVSSGSTSSTGARLVRSHEPNEWFQVNYGTDIRYVEQNLTESFETSGGLTTGSLLENFETNMPRSELVDPGLFAETSLTVLPYLTTHLGGRVDWVRTDAQAEGGFPLGVRAGGNLAVAQAAGIPLRQHDMLYSVFLRNDIDMSESWSGNVSVGYAERSPTLTERYSDGVFLGVLQSGMNRLIGDPALQKERLWQFDASVQFDYGFARGSAAFYHAWIQDYAGYEALLVADPTTARLLRSINLDLATLTGFELKGGIDVTDRSSIISTLSYVEGKDHDIDRPLPSIIPLEGRIAYRLSDDCGCGTWGAEFGVRMVATQNRAGFVRLSNGVPTEVESRTGGFTTAYIRGVYDLTENLHFVGGVENLFDRSYREHLDLVIPGDPLNSIPEFRDPTPVLSPGITPYVGAELTY